MANKTKYSKALVNEIMEDLAKGQSIRQALNKENRPCWETFRTWMRKYPEVRQQYSESTSDGIEWLLSDAQDVLNDALANSKTKDKTDLGQTHLVKAYLDMAKWKSERLNPKVYQKKDNLQLTGIDNSPIMVKWQK